MKIGRQFDFAGNELKNSHEPFLTSYRFLDYARNDRCEHLPLAMTPVYSRTNPFPGKMVVNRRLNEGNRNKETRHHEISLAGSRISFEPGDSMAVCASNDPPLV